MRTKRKVGLSPYCSQKLKIHTQFWVSMCAMFPSATGFFITVIITAQIFAQSLNVILGIQHPVDTFSSESRPSNKGNPGSRPLNKGNLGFRPLNKGNPGYQPSHKENNGSQKTDHRPSCRLPWLISNLARNVCRLRLQEHSTETRKSRANYFDRYRKQKTVYYVVFVSCNSLDREDACCSSSS